MTITFKGQPIETEGNFPAKGDSAPDFTLTKNDLTEVNDQDFKEKIKVLSIFPSIDTSVCATAARKFNEQVSDLKNVVVIGVSMDLPFALGRFCAAEGIKNVVTTSSFRHPEFGHNYGVLMKTGPLAGLLARAVLVVDSNNHVAYRELVPEITNEPNYEQAIEAVKKLSG